MRYVFDPPPRVVVPVQDDDALFPIRRVYCVGRNYAAHVAEMGGDPGRSVPFFFAKPQDAVVHEPATVAYPPATANLHHEVELVVALAGGGRDLTPDEAEAQIYGFAVGVDLTRRDLQAAAKNKGRPWTSAKGFDASAPVSRIVPARGDAPGADARMTLAVNGTLRQQARLGDMIWNVPELLAQLSRLFELRPGDLVFTGTPEGVGALERGDRVEATIDGVGTLRFAIA